MKPQVTNGIPAVLTVFGLLLVACSTSSKRSEQPESPARPARRIEAVRPQRGVPINWLGLNTYFEKEFTKLLREGKITTNLLWRIDHKTCNLNLTASATNPLPPSQLAEMIEMGTVIVGQVAQTKSGSLRLMPITGTGFIITDSGALVTCRHVLDAAYVVGLVIMTRDGQVFPVREVLAVDATNDLVILQVDGQGFTPLPLATKPAGQGTPIWVLSHPQWRYYTLTAGIVAGYGIHRGWTFMNITADFATGSSGGPVFNDRGQVVGVVRGTQNLYADPFRAEGMPQMVLKTCIPPSAVRSLITERAPNPPP